MLGNAMTFVRNSSAKSFFFFFFWFFYISLVNRFAVFQLFEPSPDMFP